MHSKKEINDVDFCVVGGGISGLYFTKRLNEEMPNASVVLLEADPKRFGGRIHVSRFHGVDVVEGAGAGRVEKDKRLLSLCRELGVSHPIKPLEINYAASFGMTQEEGARFVMDAIAEMRSNDKEERENRIHTFSTFAKEILGKRRYDTFKKLVGYTDYEAADVVDTLDDYGFDDTYTDKDRPRNFAAIEWNALISGLVSKVKDGKKNKGKNMSIRSGARVVSIKYMTNQNDDGSVCVEYMDKRGLDGVHGVHEVRCRHVVLAIPIDRAFSSILPATCTSSSSCSSCSLRCASLMKHVHTQPFLRVYAKIDRRASYMFERAMDRAMNGYTVVPSILQKIIPIDVAKGVYMVAYCDNKNALALHRILQGKQEDKNKNKNAVLHALTCLICEALGLSLPEKNKNKNNPNVLRLIDVTYFFWKAGTHYFSPLNHDGSTFPDRQSFLRESIEPLPWMTVLGEGMSTNQGWTEGALTCVDDAIQRIVSSF